MIRSQGPTLSGIPRDYVPVVNSDDVDNTGDNCIGLYIQNVGNVSVDCLLSNAPRVIPVAAGTFLPGRFTRVRSTDTTATGIFALQG